MNNKELNWELWLEQGGQYLNAASPKGKYSRFGPDVRYNLLSMSLESYIMAILDFHKTLPDNHTYTDLMNALENVIPVNDKLKDRILKYENIQSICSVDKYYRRLPTEEELKDLKGAIIEIGELANKICIINQSS